MTPEDTASAVTVDEPGRPLTWRAEWSRQRHRRRTFWSFALLLALPPIIVAAFKVGDPPPRGSTRLLDLAQLSAANFAVFIVMVTAEFLLLVLAALFAGDSLPAEASWGSLRYLLTAPVPRTRLLTSKLVVGLATIAAALALLVTWSLVVGGLAYGWGPLTNQAGGQLGWDVMAGRLALIAGYLWVTMLPVAGLAFWIGTRTDAPLAAVGGAVLGAILFTILGQIEPLGDLRRAMPLYYSREWLELLNDQLVWTELRHGLLWSTWWGVLFVALGYRGFRRKDVLS